MGTIELAGDGLEPFWPYLWLGQWTHAGKGVVMGLGGYRIETVFRRQNRLSSRQARHLCIFTVSGFYCRVT